MQNHTLRFHVKHLFFNFSCEKLSIFMFDLRRFPFHFALCHANSKIAYYGASSSFVDSLNCGCACLMMNQCSMHLDLKAIYFIESVYRNKVIIMILLKMQQEFLCVWENFLLRCYGRILWIDFTIYHLLWLIRNSLKRVPVFDYGNFPKWHEPDLRIC